MRKGIKDVLEVIEKNGILLERDPKLPAVVNIIAEEKIKGSWWGHPKGHLIFNTLCELSKRDDILRVKLLSRKFTYIHKNHWPKIFALASSDEGWQKDKLSPYAKRLYKKALREGEINTSDIAIKKLVAPKKIGQVITELEKRLLVFSTEIHTETGAHAKLIQHWDKWKVGKKLGRIPNVEVAKKEFVKMIENNNYSGVTVPWN